MSVGSWPRPALRAPIAMLVQSVAWSLVKLSRRRWRRFGADIEPASDGMVCQASGDVVEYFVFAVGELRKRKTITDGCC